MAKLKQLEEELEDLKKAINFADEEDKATYREAIAEKEQEIADVKNALSVVSKPKAEAKAEDKEDKEVKKLQEKAEKKIEKLEKELDSPKTPAKVKRAVKKSVTKLKKETKVAERVAKKEKVARKRGRPKKEAAAPKKRGRPAKKAAAAKAVKKAAPKPVKKAVKKKTKAVIKYEKVLSKLEKLVMRTKALREKYKGQGVDLERDSKRPAKPFGWRIAGSNKRPTRADIKSGRAYWEGRPNRADVKKSTFPKLAKGGMMANGGAVKGKYSVNFIKDYNETNFNKISDIEVVASSETQIRQYIMQKYPNAKILQIKKVGDAPATKQKRQLSELEKMGRRQIKSYKRDVGL